MIPRGLTLVSLCSLAGSPSALSAFSPRAVLAVVPPWSPHVRCMVFPSPSIGVGWPWGNLPRSERGPSLGARGPEPQLNLARSEQVLSCPGGSGFGPPTNLARSEQVLSCPGGSGFGTKIKPCSLRARFNFGSGPTAAAPHARPFRPANWGTRGCTKIKPCSLRARFNFGSAAGTPKIYRQTDGHKSK